MINLLNISRTILASLILILLHSFPSYCQPIEDIEKTDVSDLHPLQKNVGMRVVDIKKDKLKKMNKEELKNYLKSSENIVPVILGPGGQKFIFDHHHLVRSVLESGYHDVYTKVIYDFRQLADEQFFQELKKRKLIYLKDEGKPIRVVDLPEKIEDMKNDDYRSLSGEVRNEGGFTKDGKIPFVEFIWADFFRARIDKDLIKNHFKKSVKEALELAQSVQAKELPGYSGQRILCRSAFL